MKREEYEVQDAAGQKATLEEYRRLCQPESWHPFANAFPITRAEVRARKKEIDRRACALEDVLREPRNARPFAEVRAVLEENSILLHPVMMFEGKVLDGRVRLLACRDHLDLLRFAEFLGTPKQALDWVISENVHRRHMEKSPLAMSAALAWQAEKSAQVHSKDRKSLEEWAAEYRVGVRLVKYARELLRHPAKVEQVLAGKRRVRAALLDLEHEQAKRRVRKAAKRGRLPKAVEIIQGDFREVAASIPDASVNLIFVDPPYNKGSVPLYGDLNRLAARVLKPGGHVVAYLGDAWLPDALDLLRQPPLNFMALLHVPLVGRQQSMIRPRSVNVRCKTLVWLRNGETTWPGPMLDNLIESPPPTKDLHDWQQSSAEAIYLIDKLTLPGATVLDPMCGVGTTLEAALALGRLAIGIDKDASAVQVAKGRLAR